MSFLSAWHFCILLDALSKVLGTFLSLPIFLNVFQVIFMLEHLWVFFWVFNILFLVRVDQLLRILQVFVPEFPQFLIFNVRNGRRHILTGQIFCFLLTNFRFEVLSHVFSILFQLILHLFDMIQLFLLSFGFKLHRDFSNFFVPTRFVEFGCITCHVPWTVLENPASFAFQLFYFL